MKDIITFAAGSLAAFLTWLYPPHHKVDYYKLDAAIIIILILFHIIFKLYRKNKNSNVLLTKAVQVKKDRVIFKVNIRDIFFINGVSTLYIKSGSFYEPIAIVKIENVQDNNLIQVKIKSFINGRGTGDLDVLEVLALRPCVDFSLLEGEKYHE